MQRLHEFLRNETGEIHAEVEKHLNAQRILSPDFTLKEYLSHLQILYQAHSNLEKAIAPLKADLARLNFRLPEPALSSSISHDLLAASRNPTNSHENPPPLPTCHHAIGALYVIYGSSLGRNMIRRSLEPLLNAWNLSDAVYYGNHDDFMTDWHRFIANLGEIDPSPAEREAMKQGALTAFRAFLIESNFSTCSNPASSPKPSPHP